MKDFKQVFNANFDTDIGYLVGKARNEDVDGDGTGSPWHQIVINDLMMGPVSALFNHSDVVADNSDEKAGQSQWLSALKTLAKDMNWGDRYKGSFAKGFTYTNADDVGRGQDGNYYKYVGSDPFPKSVTAGLNPVSFPSEYEVSKVTDHNNGTSRNAVGAHDDIYVRTVSLPQAISENAPEGTVYSINGGNFTVQTTTTGYDSFSHLLANGNYLNYTPSDVVKISVSGADEFSDSGQNLIDSFLYAAELGLWVDGEGKEFLTETLVDVDVDIRLKNSTLVSDVVDLGFDFGTKTTIKQTTLTNNPILGQKVFSVADASGVQKGDLVIIKSDRIWPYDIDRNLNAGEIGLVESVSGNSITLGANLKDGYTALENVTITFYRPTKFECENVEFKRKVRENKASVAIRRCNEPKLRNVTVRDSALSGINISQCYLANISQIYLYDNYVDGTGTGYGLQDNSSLGTQIRGLVAKGNRRAVDFSGSIPSKLGSVDGFYVIGIDNAGSCLGTHGTADGIVFRNGICDGGLAGLQIRSPSSTVENVKFVNTESRCIILSYTMSLSVVNCEAQPLIHGSTVGSIAATPARFIEILDLPDDLPSSEVLTFKGNHGTVRQTVLRFLPSANDGIKYLHATNNDITIRTNSSGNDLSFIDSISPAFLSESIIKNNNITLGILGVSNKLIGNNISISTTSSLIIQKVKLEDSDFVKWAGNGSLSNVAVNVTKQSNGKTAKVRGRISFTVTGSTTGSKVRLENIFQNAEDGNVYQKVTGKKDSSFDDFLITKIEQKDLYFSSDTSAFDTPFTDGDYSIDFDITYPLRFTFENSL